ncbi:helix-turn-helix domain-containing protein [Pedobacter cryoconitis]|uniref:Helix-turn-helix protein n=1 Tax=Pedobacter cryoconitis TaxID=188932 RepID=A0A327STR0_9SPHI|nr:helix-turn-helix domain-containing protein [Pedobacter cryoconitis]RAJ31154.1 helix-turn-helix protein [Pedobacter cryoconitis]
MEDFYIPKVKHIGRNIAKIREFKGIKQEALAIDLGLSQQAISKLENEENISDERLKQIADALGVSLDIIKNFDEERVIYHINNVQNNNVTDSTFENGSALNGQFNNQFNPIEKLSELYERLLESEREKIELIKKIRNED